MKKIIAVFTLSVLMLINLAGCAKEVPEVTDEKNTDANTEAPVETKKTIGLVLSTLDNPFFVTLKEGAEEKADELGYEITVLDSQNDAAKELSNIEDLVARKVDIILINPTDSDAVVNSIKLANEKGIPVITLDRGANGGEVITHIASDNIAGGKMAGEYIIEKLNSKGNVVELEGIAGTSAARDRGEGFNSAIATSDIVVVSKQVADFDRTKGLSVMENILQAEPEIDAVFAHNDEMALGAIKAIEASGRTIMVVGFDATDDAVKSVEDGIMAATVAQQPKFIGSKGVEMADKALNGDTLEAFIPVELQLITK
ncbi:MAG: ribose ABC transporter substrate-binding protein RbsB [Firmicutes bacterium HGW-Firmicutes-7]|nr:MAG: ribose ABC transporter substrate-binding protein RbsB [Firmicutes bacterium HGW-Firmicutes-7]